MIYIIPSKVKTSKSPMRKTIQLHTQHATVVLSVGYNALILELTFCCVQRVAEMTILFRALYHQPTKTLGGHLSSAHP